MRLHCPGCGAEMSIEVLLNTEAARDAVLAALMMPAPLGKLLLQYLTLFRPRERQLSWERVATLFGDLALPLAEQKIERRGRVYAAPLEYWRSAIEEMLAKRDKLTLPLKSHGYLFEIIIGYTERREAAAEALREQNRRHRYQEGRDLGTATVGEAIESIVKQSIPEEAREKLVKLGALKPKKEGA